MEYLRELYLMIRYRISRKEAVEKEWRLSQGYEE